jgi:gas vesicle protein
MRFGKYEPSESSSVGNAITFLMIGMGAGALLALLFAPKSGKQLRKDIRRKYEDAGGAVREFAEEAQERVEEAIDRGTEWVEEAEQGARKKVAPLARALRRE